MNNTATINTRKGPRTVTELRAAQTAARSHDPRRAIDAPRGRKGAVLAMAEQIRRCRAMPGQRQLNLKARFDAHLVSIYSAVIESRGGETSIEGDSRSVGLSVTDRRSGLVLLSADGWRYYSSRFGSRRASLCYLCGTDDNGRWAVRVPGTVSTVREALYTITPAAVRKAEESGKTVLRQGDVYAVETTKANDGKGDLPERHEWDRETRTLRHLDAENTHAALSIPFPVRFVTQSTLRMGRTTRRGRGD